MAAVEYPNAFNVAVWLRCVAINRPTTTFKRNAATDRKIAGNIVDMIVNCLNSSDKYRCEIWSFRPCEPSPPYCRNTLSTPCTASSTRVPRCSVAANWLNAPVMLNAPSNGAAFIHTTQ